MRRLLGLGVGLLLVLWMAAGAMADEILFPWVVKSPSVSTIISVVNTAGDSEGKASLHFIYRYKKSTANDQTEACDHVDFCVPTSKNDVLVFDAAANINGGKPLFGDETTIGGASYLEAMSTLGLNVQSPRRAFLIVENNVGFKCANATGAGNDSLYGEAMIVDLNTGAAWGYAAYNPSSTDNFTDGYDVLGEVLASDETAQMVIMPPDVFTTKLFVTPVDNASGDMDQGDLSVGVKFYCEHEAGIYDSDENCISYAKTKKVVCTDASALDHYITEAAWNQFVSTGAEGWAYVKIEKDEDYTTDQACVGKLEYNVGSTTLDGTTIPGSTNNFIWLRADN